MKQTVLAAVLGAALLAGSAGAETTYQVDKSHATIGFQVSHLVISKVRGEFTDYEASLVLSDANELVGAKAVIQAKSIDTNNEKRDDHLRNADFFDVGSYPEITFTSTGVETEGGKKVLKGDLTIRDVTKPVALTYKVLGPIKDPWGNTKVGFEAGTTIDRTDFGLTWNKALETGGVVVGDEVELQINFEAAM